MNRIVTPRERLMPLIKAVALGHHTTPEILLSKRYPVKLWQARKILCELLREEHRYSLAQCGRLLGRHHTTILGLVNPQRRAKHLARVRGLPRPQFTEARVSVP
jgi:chromosomal replication initiation ATPase DnaA